MGLTSVSDVTQRGTRPHLEPPAPAGTWSAVLNALRTPPGTRPKSTVLYP